MSGMTGNDKNCIMIKRFFDLFIVRTLWVRSIMKAVEECRALEMSIPNDLGSLSTTTGI